MTSYCYGCVLGAVGLRYMSVVWLLLNLGYLPIMTFCGGQRPGCRSGPCRCGWPQRSSPVTHGLMAVRGVLAGAPASTVLGQAALEVLVGIGWLSVAWLALARVVRQDIAAGTLEFGG